MQAYLEKVTAFVIRRGPQGAELLLFEHPHAGIQVPAGTVEPGEPPEQAVLREVREETGLSALLLLGLIGQRDELPPGSTHVMALGTPLYARPEASIIQWAHLPRGIGVRLLRQSDGFAQVTYEEGDRYPQPGYISYQLTGWVAEVALAQTNRRYFYHLEAPAGAPELVPVYADHNHTFRPFWAPLSRLPEIIAPQRAWLDFVRGELGYDFRSSGTNCL